MSMLQRLLWLHTQFTNSVNVVVSFLLYTRKWFVAERQPVKRICMCVFAVANKNRCSIPSTCSCLGRHKNR